MAEGRIQVGISDNYLETAEFVDSEGRPIHREGVFKGSPTNVDAKQEVEETSKAARTILYLSDGSVPEDAEAGALSVVSVRHRRVHEGVTYSLCHRFATVGAGGTADILIQVGSNKELHFIFEVDSQASVTYQLFETPTVSANGTSITPRNRSREVGDNSDTTCFHTPTVTGTGTELYCGDVGTPGGGGGKGATAGNSGELLEFELPKDGVYLIRATNNEAGNKAIVLRAEWYEIS